MSIYLVPLKDWFPLGDPAYWTIREILSCSRCYACGRKNPRYSQAWAHHSIYVGYGDVWCTEKCLNSEKTWHPDKRQRRKIRRNSSIYLERV